MIGEINQHHHVKRQRNEEKKKEKAKERKEKNPTQQSTHTNGGETGSRVEAVKEKIERGWSTFGDRDSDSDDGLRKRGSMRSFPGKAAAGDTDTERGGMCHLSVLIRSKLDGRALREGRKEKKERSLSSLSVGGKTV